MSEDKKQQEKKAPLKGPVEFEEGYQPTQGNLDNSKPPQGGSGVPSTTPSDSKKSDKKE